MKVDKAFRKRFYPYLQKIKQNLIHIILGFLPPPPPRSHGSGSSGSRSGRSGHVRPPPIQDRFGSQSTIMSSELSDRTVDSEFDDNSSIA